MKLQIEYCCEHLTCRIPVCHKGFLKIDKEKFDILKQGCTEPGCFNSPSSACKIGHVQLFKILSMKEVEETEKTEEKKTINLDLSDMPSIANEVLALRKEMIQVISRLEVLEKKSSKVKRLEK